MSEVIKVNEVTKSYNLYNKPIDRLKESMSFIRRKSYHVDFKALNSISFSVNKGECFGIIGTNGSGKSTILKIITGVLQPTTGSVEVNGRVSALLELGAGFNMDYTGIENIYMNGAILGMTKKEVDEKIESIIDFSECRQFIDTPVKRYSSGMYVKLAFSVASHLAAEIMIMDEVRAVGDMAFQKKCLTKMGDEAHGGKTVLYVSHNMATIRNLCNRCIVLDKGRLIFDGDVETAIAVYMKNSEGNLKVYYDLTTSKYSSPDYGKNIKIDNFCLSSKDYPVYDTEEEMQIDFGWECIKSIENVRARIEIFYADGMVVGMTESKPILSANSNQIGNTKVKINLSNLAPGTYYMRFSLFTLMKILSFISYS